MMKAIIGFSIEVESIENVYKLSQNRDSASQQNIIDELIKRGDETKCSYCKRDETPVAIVCLLSLQHDT
ncbi:MAG: hypothetical protein WDM71_04600 [Ferruginibacter sp.]